jgi:copper chaperone CopZ
VAAADVSYEKAEALIGIEKGTAVPREAILKAIAGAGSYKGQFADRMESDWTLDVEGMTCAGCAATVKAALTKIPGVSEVSVDFESRRATLSGRQDLTEEAIRNALTDAGYGVGAAEKKQEDIQ